jgi:hypothetical protein
MRTSALSSVVEETGSSRGLEVSTLSPLGELLLLPPNLPPSITPYHDPSAFFNLDRHVVSPQKYAPPVGLAILFIYPALTALGS